MLFASRFAAAATAAFSFATVGSPAEAAPGPCGDAAEIQVLPSPFAPWKGMPLRVMIIAEKPLEGAMSLVAPDGSIVAKSAERHGGAPAVAMLEARLAVHEVEIDVHDTVAHPQRAGGQAVGA